MDEMKYAIENGGVFAQTENIILRIPTKEDMDGLVVTDKIENQGLLLNLEDEKEREWWKNTRWNLYTHPDGNSLYLSIIDAKTNKCIGKFTSQEYFSTAPEIGITLLQEYQGRGIAILAIKAYIKKNIELRNISYFTARVDLDNKSSQKMLEKIGAKKTMILRNTYCYIIDCNNIN